MRWAAAFILVLGFALAAPAPALAAPPPYYPPIEYVPAARANYDSGRTMAITQIVIHETDGTWFSAVNWFQNPRSRVSAHYLVKAWGAALRTIDDQGFVPSAGLEPETVSDEVALLQWDLAYLGFLDADEVAAGGGRFGPLTEAAVTAFQESNGVPPTGSFGAPTAAAIVQSLVANPSDVPVVDLDVDTESNDVARLQTALEKLGYIDRVTGYYGAMTSDAVSTFQQDNGIEPTGAYGPVTRMALATRLRAPAAGDELGDVAPDSQVAVVGMALGSVMFVDAAVMP